MGTVRFVNRERELEALEGWWAGDHRLGLVWGRRRVGKTALINHFVAGKRVVFHTSVGRPPVEELAVLSRAAAAVVAQPVRDLTRRPFLDWDDALETLEAAAAGRPLLLVLDEFPELVATTPELPRVLRAFLESARTAPGLRLLLCGSAVRTMEAIQRERAPLYGRLDLALLVHPFAPHEAALMLGDLAPADRALVWGVLGGVPLYLQWWDQAAPVAENLGRLAATPGGRLLIEGQMVLATEVESGDLAGRVLRAVAAGRTRHHEIADRIRADPTRTLERLVELRILERVVPVTEDPRRTRRRRYRIADNFLAFFLGVVDRYRTEIERGLGPQVLGVLTEHLDDHMGPCWEEAFRAHLRRMAAAGELGDRVMAVGPFWTEGGDSVEIDAVALAGLAHQPVLVGEAKWAKRVDGRRLEADLARKALRLPGSFAPVRFAIAARDRVDRASEQTLVLTATDLFST
ncbi:MAG: ATP-binding protein [Acidimicrobiales bacterium]